MMDNICRLCRKRLPDMKAHIMPEGLMKLIHGSEKYDGRFFMLGDGKRAKNRPTGSYDRGILCKQCDGRLGVYDEEAIKFCQRTDLTPHASGVAFTLSGVDQQKLKLFVMSYIWRASISSLEEYAPVNLGDYHTEMIRANILADDAGDINNYSVIIGKHSLPPEREKWGMHALNPVRNRLEGVNTYDIYLPNLYKVWLKVDKRLFANTFNTMSLGQGDPMLIFDLGDYTKTPEFSIMHKLIMQRKLT